jgi:hypothetical protein
MKKQLTAIDVRKEVLPEPWNEQECGLRNQEKRRDEDPTVIDEPGEQKLVCQAKFLESSFERLLQYGKRVP